MDGNVHHVEGSILHIHVCVFIVVVAHIIPPIQNLVMVLRYTMKKKKHLTHHPKDLLHANVSKRDLPASMEQLLNLANQCGGKVVPPSVNAFRFQKDDMPYRP